MAGRLAERHPELLALGGGAVGHADRRPGPVVGVAGGAVPSDARPRQPGAVRRRLVVGAQVYVWRDGDDLRQFGVLELDPTAEPKSVTARVLGGEGERKQLPGIYEVVGDELRICFSRGIPRSSSGLNPMSPPFSAKVGIRTFGREGPARDVLWRRRGQVECHGGVPCGASL